MKAAPLVLALSVSLLLLAACGGTSGTSNSTGVDLEANPSTQAEGSTTTKAKWIAAAEQICAATRGDFRRLEAEGNRLSKEPEDPHLATHLATLFEEEAEIENRVSAELRALPAPASEADAVSSMLGAAEAVPGYSEQLAEQVRSGNVRDHELLYHQRHQVAFVQSKLRGYGLERCAESFR